MAETHGAPAADARHSPIAGSWYPADPARLRDSVDGYLRAAALPAIRGRVVGLVAPHAGHLYSGPVAGHAFAAATGLAPEVVAVLGPFHDLARESVLSTAHDAYETPLGRVPVDMALLARLAERLAAAAGLGLQRLRDDPEHSVEIELPFLQRCLTRPFRLLPLMVRERRPDRLAALGAALAGVLGGRPALVVASTDLSHYHPRRVAERLDGEMLRRLAAFDPLALLQAEAQGAGEACGAGALAAALWAARALGADRVQVLCHATSADVTGDDAEVVGYGAAVITRAAGTGAPR